MSQLPNRLREFRKARGWTLEKVALDVDASIPTIADLEKGAINLTVPWMRTLAKVYGVAPADLLLAEDNPHALGESERVLVERFRRGDAHQRAQLLQMAAVIVPDAAEVPESIRELAGDRRAA